MPSKKGTKIVFGAGGVGPEYHFRSAEALNKVLDILKRYNCNTVDTAQFYSDGGSEALLGQVGAAVDHKIVIDSKAPGGFVPGSATRKKILTSCWESNQRLGLDGKGKLDIYYLHAPDRETDVNETAAGINDAYSEGLFTRFGLSNFHAEDVQKIYDICKKNGWVFAHRIPRQLFSCGQKARNGTVPHAEEAEHAVLRIHSHRRWILDQDERRGGGRARVDLIPAL